GLVVKVDRSRVQVSVTDGAAQTLLARGTGRRGHLDLGSLGIDHDDQGRGFARHVRRRRVSTLVHGDDVEPVFTVLGGAEGEVALSGRSRFAAGPAVGAELDVELNFT